MINGTKNIKTLLACILAMAIILGQGGISYLSQKLEVENTVKGRIQEALSKIIDNHKYVINVDVELEIVDEVEEQITMLSPRKQAVKKKSLTPAQETAQALLEMQEEILQEAEAEDNLYSIGLPIPGFEVDITEKKSTKPTRPKTKPIVPETMRPVDDSFEADDSGLSEPSVDKVLRSKRPARAEVKKMELSLILQEGAAPELIENIRQLTMAASKFDRSRGDKLTIMTASFKERRDKRSAEQIMLKNIAEKIDILEQKRISEGEDWKTQIESYRSEESKRREEDREFFNEQLQQMQDQAKLQAYEQEKRELMLRDSMKMDKLNTEITALKEMLTVSSTTDSVKKSKQKGSLDSARFALLDNELQGLRQMLLRSMLQDSVDAQQKAQIEIQKELEAREKEKAKRDSLLAEKIAALDIVQNEMDALQSEMEGGVDSSLLLWGLAALVFILLAAVIFMLLRNKQGPVPPMPPYMYAPPPRGRPRRRPQSKKKKKKAAPKNDSGNKKDDKVETLGKSNNESTSVQSNGSAGSSKPGGEELPVTPSVPVSEDPNVVRSEIDDIRKSVVSMSVGQPERTTTIVKEWLEQPAPVGGDAPVEDGSGESEEADSETTEEAKEE
tara:strand:- start:1984 stop:3828 length:1845 start_codon:yes stop_codon:yes gene_type:complete